LKTARTTQSSVSVSANPSNLAASIGFSNKSSQIICEPTAAPINVIKFRFSSYRIIPVIFSPLTLGLQLAVIRESIFVARSQPRILTNIIPFRAKPAEGG
jgi:hypothetical protein